MVASPGLEQSEVKGHISLYDNGVHFRVEGESRALRSRDSPWRRGAGPRSRCAGREDEIEEIRDFTSTIVPDGKVEPPRPDVPGARNNAAEDDDS